MFIVNFIFPFTKKLEGDKFDMRGLLPRQNDFKLRQTCTFKSFIIVEQSI